MSRRRPLIATPQASSAPAVPVAPWLQPATLPAPAFTWMRQRRGSGPHGWSTCLYHEPSFAERFPHRDFRQRYLAQRDVIAQFIGAHNGTFVIFTDEAMLDTAMDLQLGSVALVHEPAVCPWAQHLWRYYAVLAAQEFPAVKAWHFRGLDNVHRDDVAMLDRFLTAGFDLLRASYRRGTPSLYTPVRGSCSVAAQGIPALAWGLRHRAPQGVVGADAFHCDERWLARWFEACQRWLNTFSFIDRSPAKGLWLDTLRSLRYGLRVHLEGQITDDGPLRSKKDPSGLEMVTVND